MTIASFYDKLGKAFSSTVKNTEEQGELFKKSLATKIEEHRAEMFRLVLSGINTPDKKNFSDKELSILIQALTDNDPDLQLQAKFIKLFPNHEQEVRKNLEKNKANLTKYASTCLQLLNQGEQTRFSAEKGAADLFTLALLGLQHISGKGDDDLLYSVAKTAEGKDSGFNGMKSISKARGKMLVNFSGIEIFSDIQETELSNRFKTKLTKGAQELLDQIEGNLIDRKEFKNGMEKFSEEIPEETKDLLSKAAEKAFGKKPSENVMKVLAAGILQLQNDKELSGDNSELRLFKASLGENFPSLKGLVDGQGLGTPSPSSSMSAKTSSQLGSKGKDKEMMTH